MCSCLSTFIFVSLFGNKWPRYCGSVIFYYCVQIHLNSKFRFETMYFSKLLKYQEIYNQCICSEFGFKRWEKVVTIRKINIYRHICHYCPRALIWYMSSWFYGSAKILTQVHQKWDTKYTYNFPNTIFSVPKISDTTNCKCFSKSIYIVYFLGGINIG